MLTVHLPKVQRPLLGGFVLVGNEASSSAVVFRRNWEGLCSEDDGEVLAEMEETLQAMLSGAASAEAFLEQLEDQLANTIRCLGRVCLPNTVPFATRLSLLREALVADSQAG